MRSTKAPRCAGSVIVQREEALDAQFLKRDVLRGAKYGDGRKEVKTLFAVLEADGHHGDQRRAQIRRAPARGDARIVEHFGQQGSSTVIENPRPRLLGARDGQGPGQPRPSSPRPDADHPG